MKATFEITGSKKGKRLVVYYTVSLYNGVAKDLHERYEKLGYEDINVRMVF